MTYANKISLFFIFLFLIGILHQKKRRSAFLLFVAENGSDEGRELLVGFWVGELCSPTLVEFHETRMGLVADDDLGIAAGFGPITALTCFCGSERVLGIIPFVLDKDLVRTGAYFFAGKRVMEVFLLGDRDVIHSLGSCFLECAGDTIDPVADSKMSHNDKDNK